MSKTTVPSGRWAHIGYTWDEKMITFYLDGKEDGETAISTMSVPQRRGTRIYVGSNATGGHDYFIGGLIGSIVLYNRTLAAGEVQQLHVGTRSKFR